MFPRKVDALQKELNEYCPIPRRFPSQRESCGLTTKKVASCTSKCVDADTGMPFERGFVSGTYFTAAELNPLKTEVRSPRGNVYSLQGGEKRRQ